MDFSSILILFYSGLYFCIFTPQYSPHSDVAEIHLNVAAPLVMRTITMTCIAFL